MDTAIHLVAYVVLGVGLINFVFMYRRYSAFVRLLYAEYPKRAEETLGPNDGDLSSRQKLLGSKVLLKEVTSGTLSASDALQKSAQIIRAGTWAHRICFALLLVLLVASIYVRNAL